MKVRVLNSRWVFFIGVMVLGALSAQAGDQLLLRAGRVQVDGRKGTEYFEF